MNAIPIMIFGCGYQGKIVYEALKKTSFSTRFFVDDHFSESTYRDVPVLRRAESVKQDIRHIVVALGNDSFEKIQFKRSIIEFYTGHQFAFPSVIDPSAVISSSAQIEEGVIIHPGVVVMSDTRIDAFSIVSTRASIDHDNQLKAFSNICPGVVTAGTVTIEQGAFIGTNATIIPSVTIGEYAVIGAGCVVLKDVDAHTTVVGNPARLLRKKEVTSGV